MSSFRAASFNVENLFSRARVFNIRDKSVGDAVLQKIDELDKLLRKSSYSAADKRAIVRLYQEDEVDDKQRKLKHYIEIREDRGKLFRRSGFAITGVKADGAGGWDGGIEFKRADASELARENTARVIKEVRAKVACIVEAENRISLHHFNRELLDSRKFDYSMLIDGNDRRGIDVGLLTDYPIHGVWSHIYDGPANSRTFSRDCLEVEVELPNGEFLYVLCNHLKSRGYGSEAGNNARRERQAKAIAEILEGYDLREEWVIVAGDLNDSPTRPPRVLRHLLDLQNLHDVLELQFPDNPERRWTYHFREFEQIDYLLVSEPLRERFVRAGVERRGMYRLKQLTSGSGGAVPVEEQFDTVTHWTNAASDHGAVWADFEL